MGRGIVVALVRTGMKVVAVETQEKQLADAKREITGTLERGAARLGVAPPLANITYSSSIQSASGVDLVVEAVFEDMGIKEKIFQQLSAICKPGALLCSNTSTLDVDHLASQTRRPELVVGMHFFAPAHVMKLLEVVCGARSSPEAVATAMQLGKRMGKVSVAVGNCHGFVGNRMLQPFMDQAQFMVEEGAPPELIDDTLVEFGYVMGPLRMSDLSGLDIGWRIRKGAGLLESSSGGSAPVSRFRQGRRYSPLGDLLCENGRLGQKAGKGWYLYDKPGGREAKPDPWVRNFLEGYRARQGIVGRRIDSLEVLERCVYTLINEGFKVLEDGIASGPEDIDMIYVFGYSWPRHRGGPMFYASTVGLPKVLERLEHYRRAHPDVPALEPSRLLRKMAASGNPPIRQWRELIKQVRSQL